MANWVSLELANGRNNAPSYNPYVVPALGAAPLPNTTADHIAALTRWSDYARKAKRPIGPTPPPFQDWVLYNIRFLITADRFGAWSTLGGLPAKIPHIAILLNICNTETSSIPLSYGRIVRDGIQERARSRRDTSGTGFIEMPAAENARLKTPSIR